MTRQGSFELPTELTSRGREDDAEDAPLILSLSVGQCRRGVYTPEMESYPRKPTRCFNPQQVGFPLSKGDSKERNLDLDSTIQGGHGSSPP